MFKLQLEFTFRSRVSADKFISRYVSSRMSYSIASDPRVIFRAPSWNPSFPAKFYLSLKTPEWNRVVSTMRYLNGRVEKGEFKFRVLTATETKVEDISRNIRVMMEGFKKKGGELAGV